VLDEGLLAAIAEGAQRSGFDGGGVAHSQSQAALCDPHEVASLEPARTAQQRHEQGGLSVHRAGSARPRHREQRVVCLSDGQPAPGRREGEHLGNEPQVPELLVASPHIGVGRPIGARQRSRQQPLADAELDAFIRRPQLPLQQVHDGRTLGGSGAVEQRRHDAHGLEPPARRFEPREALCQLAQAHAAI